MTLISILLKASILLGVVTAAQSLLARRVSAATRHLIWALAIVGLLLPPLSLTLPGWAAVRLAAGDAGSGVHCGLAGVPLRHADRR